MIKIVTHRLKRPIAAAFIGALTTLAFAPYDFWPLAILSPLLLLLLFQNQSRKQAGWLGFCWGLGQFGTGISWVHVSIDSFGGMPEIATIILMSLLVAYLALYPALFGWALNRFFPHTDQARFFLAAPTLWLICDWLRGWVFTGFPWLWLGYSQINSPLAYFAPIGGVKLLTLLTLICAAAFCYMWLKRNWNYALIPLIILAAGYGLKSAHWVTPDTDRVAKIALIQGNIDQAKKWLPGERWPTLMKYMDLTRENWGSDLIIWPEAAIPALEAHIPVFLQGLDDAARANNSTVITGILDQKPDGQFFNNILTLGVDADGPYNYDTATRYSKHHLLPFGEFVPFGDLLRPIAPLFNLPMSSFSRGAYIQPNIQAHGYSIAPALCYEVAFSEQMRENITNHTEMLLTLSNDAWFGRSIGPFQHMEIAQMRALELGKPLLRATNTGITAVVNHEGHITKKLPQFVTGVLKATVIPTIGMTPYTTLGSWPLYFYGLWAFALSWILIRRQRGHFRDTRELEAE